MSVIVKHVTGGTIDGAGGWSISQCVYYDTLDISNVNTASMNVLAGQVQSDAANVLMGGTNDVSALMGSGTRLAQTLSYAYATAGSPRPSWRGEGNAPQDIGLTTPVHPPQIALVVTLLSGLPGGSFRGRFYLPALGTSLSGSSLQISAADGLRAANAAAAFLAAVRAHSLGGVVGQNVVWSREKAIVSTVTTVRVDSVLDTVRARRNKVVALRRTSVPIPVP